MVLNFDPDSIPPQSKRAGQHKWFMGISDQCDADGLPLSFFAKTLVWKRRVVPNPWCKQLLQVPMLPQKSMVEPRRDFTFAAAVTNMGISKIAARKQWLGGWQVVAAFHDSLWAGAGVDSNRAAAWIDVFAYDHSTAECLMRRSSRNQVPQQICIGVAWAEHGSREEAGNHTSAVQENAKVVKWLKGQVKRKLQACAQDGILAIPGWKPLPKDAEIPFARAAPELKLEEFVATYPACSNHLPIRATFLELVASRVQSPEPMAKWEEAVAKHNLEFNKSGVAWEDDKKRLAADEQGGGPQKKPKLMQPSDGSPTSIAELEQVQGKLLAIDIQAGLKIYIAPASGEVWAWPSEDCTLKDNTPLALVFGSFKLDEDGGTKHKFPAHAVKNAHSP